MQSADHNASAGFYIKPNAWGSLGLNFDYDGVLSLKMGVPSFCNNKSRYTRLKGND